VRRVGHELERARLLPRAVLSRLRQARAAEEATADWLVLRGFRILATNLRLGALELDIVAKRGGLVVIVEVRTRGRGSYVSALASVSVAKRRHLLRAGERLWRAQLASAADVERVRIDVAAVSFEEGATFVEYIPGAVVA